jgi:hypothetical protein
MHGAKSLDDVDASTEDRETEKIVNNRDAVDAAIQTGAASVSSEAGRWPPITVKSATQTASLRQDPPDKAPATPILPASSQTCW